MFVASPPDGHDNKISLDAIKTHIGDALNIQWLKMAAFLVHGRHSCVDGRDDSGVVGTPGNKIYYIYIYLLLIFFLINIYEMLIYVCI
jgi:hypothetical protein